jgi:uncharacterized membrane protein YfcA
MHLQTWQWVVAGLAAAGVGVSKTGMPGAGILAVALFTLVVPARESVGLLLPLLIGGDVVAVASYHHHANWRQLVRLFPWAGAGVLAGWLLVGVIKGEATFDRVIGSVLIALVILQIWRSRRPRVEGEAPNIFWTPCLGFLAGVLTMVANAAGPVMVLYLLGMGLPKLIFMGTGAWYYLIVNSFKVPFFINLGTITHTSILIDSALLPLVWLGAWGGRLLLPKIDQRAFEFIALGLTVVAALKLLL